MVTKRLIRLGEGSVALVIPHETAKAAGFRIGDLVQVRLRRSVVEIAPVRPREELAGQAGPGEVPP